MDSIRCAAFSCFVLVSVICPCEVAAGSFSDVDLNNNGTTLQSQGTSPKADDAAKADGGSPNVVLKATQDDESSTDELSESDSRAVTIIPSPKLDDGAETANSQSAQQSNLSAKETFFYIRRKLLDYAWVYSRKDPTQNTSRFGPNRRLTDFAYKEPNLIFKIELTSLTMIMDDNMQLGRDEIKRWSNTISVDLRFHPKVSLERRKSGSYSLWMQCDNNCVRHQTPSRDQRFDSMVEYIEMNFDELEANRLRKAFDHFLKLNSHLALPSDPFD